MVVIPRVFRLRQIILVCIFLTFIIATVYLHQSQLNFIKSFNNDVGVGYHHQTLSVAPNHIANHPYFKYSLDQLENPNGLALDATTTNDTVAWCQLTRVHPFHPSTWKYFPPSKPIICKIRQPPYLTFIDGTGYLRFNQSELSEQGYGPIENPSVTCRYSPVLRKEGNDFEVEYGPEQELPVQGVLLRHDYVLVTCYAKILGFINTQVSSNFHVNARPIRESSKTTQPIVNQPINVVIFGVDSLSRLAFIRFLPKTYKYLTETMGAYVFKGMNKVADNTFPNLAAILTGDKAYGGQLPLPPTIPHYDTWPLVWKNYSKYGYTTLFDEDYPDYNMFTYLSTGFKVQPTDYYLRPFWLAVTESSQLRYSSHMCLGHLRRHQYQINHLLSYLRRYGARGGTNGTSWTRPGFAFSFLAEVTHEYLSRASAADSDFENMLKTITQEGLLGDNTFFAFMSDHGHRFDAIRETPIGRLEERMPFFAVIPPKSLPNRNLLNLKVNTAKLTSPFDHHATLVDIINHVTNGSSQLGTTITRYGRSLFGTIPLNRTCDQAGIPEFFCACGMNVDTVDLSLNSKESSRLAESAGRTVIARVNWLLKDVKDKCQNLSFESVKSLQKIGETTTKLTIVVKASPSGALFESNLEQNVIGGQLKVIGEISRINKYRGQSECVKDPILRKYCYCKT